MFALNKQDVCEKKTLSFPKYADITTKLLERGLVTEEQLKIAKSEQRHSSLSFENTLIKLGFITESILQEVLSEISGHREISLSRTIINPTVVRQFPKDLALRFLAIPIDFSENSLIVAVTNIFDILALDQLKRFFPKNDIQTYIAKQSDILQVIEDAHEDEETNLSSLFQRLETNEAKQNGDDNLVVRVVNSLLLKGIQKKASDIHFQPESHFVRMCFRRDGQLHQVMSFHKSLWGLISNRLKILAEMNIAEKRKPQSGRFSFLRGSFEIDFRVSSHPTMFGENFVLRILDKSQDLRSMPDLGFSASQVETLKKSLRDPQGLYVITGPTGSGKTTTLYSILKEFDAQSVNIMTLEDPIEYSLPQIRQSEIKHFQGYADGIRSMLRQDPDIILIGEIRDEDTAKMAFRAAMTGHKVLTTLHTNNALGALERLLELGIPHSLIEDNLKFATAQRLLRRLCPQCKRNDIPAPEHHLKTLVYKAVGCERCQFKGYDGRFAVTEIVNLSRKGAGISQKLTSKSVSRTNTFQYFEFQSLWDAGLEKVLSGDTSLEELKSCVSQV